MSQLVELRSLQRRPTFCRSAGIAAILALTLCACSDSDEAVDPPDPEVGVLEALFGAAEEESFSSGTDAAQSHPSA